MPILPASYDLFNSSKIFSYTLTDTDLKHNLGPDEKPKHEFGKIMCYRFDVLPLRKYSAFIKVSCCIQDLALIYGRGKSLC